MCTIQVPLERCNRTLQLQLINLRHTSGFDVARLLNNTVHNNSYIYYRRHTSYIITIIVARYITMSVSTIVSDSTLKWLAYIFLEINNVFLDII